MRSRRSDADARAWSERVYGADDVIRLDSLDMDIAMQHIYEGAWR